MFPFVEITLVAFLVAMSSNWKTKLSSISSHNIPKIFRSILILLSTIASCTVLLTIFVFSNAK